MWWYLEFGNQGFWLPGGKVDAGEAFTVAAKRECMEEAGVDIELIGVLAIEMHPFPPRDMDGCNLVRMRSIFLASPTDAFMLSGKLPKSVSDFESVGACWCSLADLKAGLKVRGSEPMIWMR